MTVKKEFEELLTKHNISVEFMKVWGSSNYRASFSKQGERKMITYIQEEDHITLYSVLQVIKEFSNEGDD